MEYVTTEEIFSDNMLPLANLQTGDNSSSYWRITSNIICCHTVNMWLLFRWKNIGIIAFLRTSNMVFANLTYLEALTLSICIFYLVLQKLWLVYQKRHTPMLCDIKLWFNLSGRLLCYVIYFQSLLLHMHIFSFLIMI
jgi:hypothetical protein